MKCGRPEDSTTASPGVESPFAQLGLLGTVMDWVLSRFGGIRTGRGAPGAVHIAEVEVDTWLGHVRVTRMFAGLCVGKPQAPMLARSQAEGSIIQGIGYALYEGRQVDAATGAVLTAGLEDYRIPGIADIPDMHIHFDEGGFDHVAGGGVGIGEISTLPVAAAVANAIHNATGKARARAADPPGPPAGAGWRREGRMTAATTMRNRRPAPGPELLAGGTDLIERRRSGVSRGPVTELPRTAENTRIAWTADGAAVIGSHVAIAEVAGDARLAQAYPGLAAAAGGLATPQIRAIGTIGGNLAQRSRCWYYRNPHMACLKKGDDTCPARSGNHLYGVIFDLWALRGAAPLDAGSRAAGLRRDRDDEPSQPSGNPGPAGGWQRRHARPHAGAGRADPVDQSATAGRRRTGGLPPCDQPHLCRMAAGRGGRAHCARWRQGSGSRASRSAAWLRCRCRLRGVEDALAGQPLSEASIAAAAKAAAAGAKPLPLTGYKVALLEGLVASMLGGLRG